MYERFRRHSLPKVSLEFMLVCLGYNIIKLFKYYDGNAKFDYWKIPDNIIPENLRNLALKDYQKKPLRLNKNLLIKRLKIIINMQNKKAEKPRI